MEKQISFKLRSANQFNIDSMSAHLNLKAGKAIIDNNIKTIIISPEKQSTKTIKKLLKRVTSPKHKDFLCLQSLDNTDEATRNLIISSAYKNIGTLYKS